MRSIVCATDGAFDLDHFLTPHDAYDLNRLKDTVDVDLVLNLAGRYTDPLKRTPRELGVDMWRIRDGRDVLVAIAALRDHDVDARPLYLFGFEGHWSLEPGAEAAHRQPTEGAALPAGDDARSGPTVVVVDAGFSGTLPASIPGSLDREIADILAMEVHGSLVKSIIEMTAPGVTVITEEVSQLGSGHLRRTIGAWQRGPHSRTACTDEMAVVDALITAGAKAAAAGGATCVNLSLGTYLVAEELGGGVRTDITPMTMEYQLSDGGPVFIAAAGNDLRGSFDWPRFYPACRPDVVGVGAADRNDSPVLWNHGMRVHQKRAWWNVQAPGVDVCGLPADTQDDDYELLRWSGSSFAAAVATGMFAKGTLQLTPASGSGFVERPLMSASGLRYLNSSSTVSIVP